MSSETSPLPRHEHPALRLVPGDDADYGGILTMPGGHKVRVRAWEGPGCAGRAPRDIPSEAFLLGPLWVSMEVLAEDEGGLPPPGFPRL